MKKHPMYRMLAVCLLAGLLHNAAIAQTAAALFNSSTTPIIWLGVDFTQVTALGETGTVSGVEMVQQFAKINDVIINEAEKYNFKEALNKNDIPYDLGPVTKANAGIDAEKIVSTSSADKGRQLNEETIAQLVKNYSVKNTEGAGLIIFMETLDKPHETGVMWVTFFDLSSKKVLLTEKMQGKAAGFGFRNHWARTVYEVITEIKKSKYKAWKAKYGKS